MAITKMTTREFKIVKANLNGLENLYGISEENIKDYPKVLEKVKSLEKENQELRLEIENLKKQFRTYINEEVKSKQRELNNVKFNPNAIY